VSPERGVCQAEFIQSGINYRKSAKPYKDSLTKSVIPAKVALQSAWNQKDTGSPLLRD